MTREKSDSEQADIVILVVDDDPVFRESMRRLLWTLADTLPTRVLEAADGESARSRLRAEPVDCILLDHRMPGGSGVDWLERLQAVQPGVPVIMITGQGDEETAVAAMKHGAADYLVKGTVTGPSLARTVTAAIAASEQRQAEAEQRRQRLAEERGRMVEEMRTVMETSTHALRTPLWALQEFATMLNEDSLDQLSPDSREYLGQVLAGAGRLTALVNALTEYAAVCQHPFNPEPVDLGAIARTLCEACRRAEPARSIRFATGEGLTAQADPDLMRIVLDKLLTNAMTFTRCREEAQIRLDRVPNDTEATFVIADNGAGFDPALIHKLFRPFQRLHVEETYAGLGMGLAIARRVIHLHGGRIWAEGNINQGAKFTFTLPNGGPDNEEDPDRGR